MHIKVPSKYNNINVNIVTWAVVYSLFMSARTASDPACQIYISGVYILHKINFFPAAKIYIFSPPSFFQQWSGKIFSELFHLFILSPFSNILLVFFTKEGRKWKRCFQFSSFLHFVSPNHIFFIFWEKIPNIFLPVLVHEGRNTPCRDLIF